MQGIFHHHHIVQIVLPFLLCQMCWGNLWRIIIKWHRFEIIALPEQFRLMLGERDAIARV